MYNNYLESTNGQTECAIDTQSLPVAPLYMVPVVPSTPPRSNIFAIVTFAIGQQDYGLPVTEVREIVRLPALLILAGAPPYLRGLLNFRGRHLPVLDGRVLVGEHAVDTLACHVVIAGRSSPAFGLLVDQARDVQIVPIGQATSLGTDTAPLLQGVYTLATGSMLLFDYAALLKLVPAVYRSTQA